MSAARAAGAERVDFQQGGLLAAPDLAALAAHEARLRGLHIRAVHGAWGVAEGLLPRLARDRRAVLVPAGAAYDLLGRELVLTATTRLPAPTRRAGFPADVPPVDLLLRLDAPPGGPTGGPGGRPRLRWAAADPTDRAGLLTDGEPVRVGIDVPLARFLVEEDGRLRGPVLAVRRTVRARRSPRVASGLTRPGALTWTNVRGRITATLHTTWSDTTSQPRYVVRLVGNPWSHRLAAPDPDDLPPPLPMLAVTALGTATLQLEIFLAQRDTNASAFAAILADLNRATVLWIAAEAGLPDDLKDMTTGERP